MPINKYEPIHDANMIDNWFIDFTKVFEKIKEREKYDKVYELIKKKMVDNYF